MMIIIYLYIHMYTYLYIYIYYVYIQVWHLITQKQENTSQIKAVGALVCHKLRKSQTLAFCSKFTRYCFAS